MTDTQRLNYADSAGIAASDTCSGSAYTPQTLQSTSSARDYFEYCTHYNSAYTSSSAVGTSATADVIDDAEAGFNTDSYSTFERCVGGDVGDTDSGAGRLGLSVFIAAFAGLAL